ncbi:MAG: GntR family transcriptional regulator [Ignavibacteriales bacterium]
MKAASEHKTKSGIVYESLKSAIVGGDLLPGTRIIIHGVANALKVSEIPVREALRKLEADGLVKCTPYVGALVSVPSIEDLRETLVIRSVLEPLAARLSAPKLREKDVSRMSDLLDSMSTLVREQKYWDYSRVDREFHNVLYSRCGNRKLKDLIGDMWSQTERASGAFRAATVSAAQSLAEHTAMLDALRAKDFERLESLVSDQVLRVGSEVQNLAAQYGPLV